MKANLGPLKNMGFNVFKILFMIGVLFAISKGNIIVQSDTHCGSNMKPKEERVADLAQFNVYSHSQEYYYPARDCVIVLIGQEYHQWEIEIQNIDIDGHECKHSQPCCNDYLKIFNAYTVDNARLFPSIPWRGLCGEGIPKNPFLTSTQNYITIQFNADHRFDTKKGFQLALKQIPRKSAGSDFYGTGFGGWNDGTLNELQIDWNEQKQIPGDYRPGKDPTFDPDPNGVSCYLCSDCKKDYFKSSDAGVSKKDGCYVCTKEWLRGSGKAVRNCLSKSMFQSKLLTLREVSTGADLTTDFRSCEVFTRAAAAVSTIYVHMCVCDSNNCNDAALVQPCFATAMLFLFLAVFYHKI